MIVELFSAVLTGLASKLTEVFLDRRRTKVSVAELEQHIQALVAGQERLQAESGEVRKAFVILTGYLLHSQGQIFVGDSRHKYLQLAPIETPESLPIIRQAIEDFAVSAERKIHDRVRADGERNTGDSARRTAVEAAARKDFFDGFEAEVMRARTGAGDNA